MMYSESGRNVIKRVLFVCQVVDEKPNLDMTNKSQYAMCRLMEEINYTYIHILWMKLTV